MTAYSDLGNSPKLHPQPNCFYHIPLPSIVLFQNYRTPWLKIWRSPAVWAIVVANVCDNWGFYTFLTGLPSYLKEVLNFSIQEVHINLYHLENSDRNHFTGYRIIAITDIAEVLTISIFDE